MTRARVVVIGSINRDHVCRVSSLPGPGETVLGAEVVHGAGGKGSNQAVAAARIGVPVAIVGCVGDDEDGRRLAGSLHEQGVDVSAVAVDADAPTGAAFVFVEPRGENSIVVAPGANAALSAEHIRAATKDCVSATDVVVVQAEIPVPAIVAAVELAADAGARLVLNLAPFQHLPAEVLAAGDPLVVNEAEAKALLGLEPDADTDGSTLASRVSERARSAVVTMGAGGAVIGRAGRVERVGAPTVEVVDSTGAGDALTGVLAARLSQGVELSSAVRAGVQAGTYAVQHHGAQASFGTLRQIRGG